MNRHSDSDEEIKSGVEMWQCLARHVCNLDTLHSRRLFMLKWKKRHGEESALRLSALVKSEWGKKNGRHQTTN